MLRNAKFVCFSHLALLEPSSVSRLIGWEPLNSSYATISKQPNESMKVHFEYLYLINLYSALSSHVPDVRSVRKYARYF